MGQLALITGASSGIGYALALELAAYGYDLIATGRDAAKLGELSEQCAKRHGSRVRTIAQDLAAPGGADALLKALGAEIDQLDALVNNAGFGVHGEFATTALSREADMLSLQIGAMLVLTKAVLPGMRERKRGRILNVASVYSFIPVPYQSVYGATKSFMLSFSEALAFELKDFGISVSCLCPGTTITSFRSREGIPEKLKGMSSESVARIGLHGLMKGRRVIVPGAHNKALVFLASWLPHAITMRALAGVNRYRGVGQNRPF